MKNLMWTMVLGFAAGATAAIAQECATIDNDLDRLACYDKESGRTPQIEIVAAIEESKWAVRTETSEFEDTTNVYLTTLSEEPLKCSVYGTPKRATLFLRCLENTTSIFIASDCHVASGFQGYGQVDVRIDDKQSFSRNFDASTDNSALGLWRGNAAIPFIKRLFEGRRVLFRFTPFNESPVTVEFDITGVEDAIGPLRKACRW